MIEFYLILPRIIQHVDFANLSRFYLSIYFQNKQGPPPHPFVPRNGTGRAGGKPPTARGHVKKVKGKKGKKGKKDQYDLIVNIDLVSI